MSMTIRPRDYHVVECPPHLRGVANCIYCHAAIDLTFRHYRIVRHEEDVATVREHTRTTGYTVCAGCKEQAMYSALTDDWPEPLR